MFSIGSLKSLLFIAIEQTNEFPSFGLFMMACTIQNLNDASFEHGIEQERIVQNRQQQQGFCKLMLMEEILDEHFNNYFVSLSKVAQRKLFSSSGFTCCVFCMLRGDTIRSLCTVCLIKPFYGCVYHIGLVNCYLLFYQVKMLSNSDALFVQ